MSSAAPSMFWSKASGAISNRVPGSTKPNPTINETDSDSDSDSDSGGVLLVADEHGSHVPIITRKKKTSRFELLQQKKLKEKVQEISSGDQSPKSTAPASTDQLETAVSALTVTDSRAARGEEGSSAVDGFAAFASVRRKPQSGVQPGPARTEEGGRISWWLDDVAQSSEKLPAAPTMAPTADQDVPNASQHIAYSDVVKQEPVSRLTATAEPSSPKKVLSQLTAGNVQDVLSVSKPRALATRASSLNPPPTSTMATSKPRNILSLGNWRARSDNGAATSSDLVTSNPMRAPLSYAKVVAAPTVVPTAVPAAALLPRRELEARRVAQEVSRYRKDHGLSEKSYFTPMVKVESDLTGKPRPKPAFDSSVPVSESTAVYLKGLPGATTYYDLLENIHCGQIWHTYIDPPNPPKQLTSAAKVAFLTRVQAEAFMDDIQLGRYSVRGQRVTNCIWDRRGEMEREDLLESRCIQIQGPASMMEWAWFEREFTAKLDLKITDYFEVQCKEENSKIFQINFAGIYAQSRAVIKALEKDFGDIYSYRYVADPCNDGEY